MNKYTRTMLTTILAFSLNVISASADDWTTWRGPTHNGISKETGWNAQALNAPKIKWSINVGKGHSSVAVQGKKLYTMGNTDNVDAVICIDTSSGSELWRHEYKCKAGNYDGPRCTPVIDGKNLYTLSRSGDLLCLDAAKGNVIWKKNVVSEFSTKNIGWGYASSARIEGNILMINVGNNGMAFNKTSGDKLWGGPGANKCGYATPVVFGSTKKQAAIFGAKNVNIVDIKTGKVIKSFPWKTAHDVNAADPVISGTIMFISSGYDKGCALLDIAGTAPKLIWQNRNMRNHFTTSILIDGYLYGIDGNTGKGSVKCLDFKTGAEKWAQKGGYEGIMAADGKLIVMDRKGVLTIAKVSPASFSVISKGQVLKAKGVVNWPSPVLSNGQIYCRNAIGDLVCVDVSK